MSSKSLSPGDPWPEHYRGFTFHMNPDGEIWWRQYNGEQRLFVEDPPAQLVANLLDVKPYGAQFRVTEHNDVIAKVEDEKEGTYEPVYVGQFEDARRLLPGHKTDFAINLRPDNTSEGHLWPSVYDGARYSLTDSDRIWWEDPDSHLRHPVESGIPDEIATNLTFYKQKGGSFRITPWGDVITLIDTVPEPEDVIEQFQQLPRAIRNIIQLRKSRGLDMLPIYIGNIGERQISLGDPNDLTSDLSKNLQQDIEEWIQELGPTSSASDTVTDKAPDQPRFDDDPEEWATETLEEEFNDDNGED